MSCLEEILYAVATHVHVCLKKIRFLEFVLHFVLIFLLGHEYMSLGVLYLKFKFLLQALIVHYQSYNSAVELILSVDDEVFPDYSQLLDDFSESLQQIKVAASRLSMSLK
jgi:hypothetical protein